MNMDKNLIAERFSKAIGTYTQEANIQQQIAEKMIHLLQQYLPPTPLGKVVEFGCGTMQLLPAALSYPATEATSPE